MVVGGPEGETIADLKEYFYYAQIRRQGLSSMARREVSDKIPLNEVPDIMRAIGFFPTKRQIEVGVPRPDRVVFSLHRCSQVCRVYSAIGHAQ